MESTSGSMVQGFMNGAVRNTIGANGSNITDQ